LNRVKLKSGPKIPWHGIERDHPHEEEKKHAPVEWSFCSAKDLDEDEPVDWWKTP
jgi:hypothetical protein